MGNGFSFFRRSRAAEGRRSTVEPCPSIDETEGHSFQYIQTSSASSSPQSRRVAISGASVSGNFSRRIKSLSSTKWESSASPSFKYPPSFEGSRSFPAAPLRLSSSSSSNPVSPRGRQESIFRNVSMFLQRRSESFRVSWSRRESLLQWAHGKAGEDRMHVVVSEDHRWLFVGIYDGFHDSEAAEFLVANLYKEVFSQLMKLRQENAQDSEQSSFLGSSIIERTLEESQDNQLPRRSFSVSSSLTFLSRSVRNRISNWKKQSQKMDFLKSVKIKERKQEEKGGSTSHKREKTWKMNSRLVLEALSRALDATESEFFWMMSMGIYQRPELALSGSCVLVVLIMDDDVYVMNVGDSRAVVAQQGSNPSSWNEGLPSENEIVEEIEDEFSAFQLSTDHNTSNKEEVLRIKEEHQEDSKCIVNNKVKGRLQVTRAFGAGFLKQPALNGALLEALRSDYVGSKAYISCIPSLRHHKISQSDKFLVISSDGLYQYLTKEEVVSHVNIFMERFPDGNPAQNLINEALLRAAHKFGLDFHALLAVPPGCRRSCHDDITVVVVSLEGGMWESTGRCSATTRGK